MDSAVSLNSFLKLYQGSTATLSSAGSKFKLRKLNNASSIYPSPDESQLGTLPAETSSVPAKPSSARSFFSIPSRLFRPLETELPEQEEDDETMEIANASLNVISNSPVDFEPEQYHHQVEAEDEENIDPIYQTYISYVNFVNTDDSTVADADTPELHVAPCQEHEAPAATDASPQPNNLCDTKYSRFGRFRRLFNSKKKPLNRKDFKDKLNDSTAQLKRKLSSYSISGPLRKKWDNHKNDSIFNLFQSAEFQNRLEGSEIKQRAATANPNATQPHHSPFNSFRRSTSLRNLMGSFVN